MNRHIRSSMVRIPLSWKPRLGPHNIPPRRRYPQQRCNMAGFRLHNCPVYHKSFAPCVHKMMHQPFPRGLVDDEGALLRPFPDGFPVVLGQPPAFP